ncbi:MAG TPA: MerR family transcriptional regulator [Solirubrobacteraceae bacterium]|nr:MerR family transcriptional regulator [Solirubrobacteraceae bacterium]
MDEPTLTIGEVSRRGGVATSAIRYYERAGVLPRAERVGGQRRYGLDAVRRLGVVAIAQQAGFTLAEIRELLAGTDAGAPAGDALRALAERKLPEVEALIARAEAMRAWLELARECGCPSFDVCALFDAERAAS